MGSRAVWLPWRSPQQKMSEWKGCLLSQLPELDFGCYEQEKGDSSSLRAFLSKNDNFEALKFNFDVKARLRSDLLQAIFPFSLSIIATDWYEENFKHLPRIEKKLKKRKLLLLHFKFIFH